MPKIEDFDILTYDKQKELLRRGYVKEVNELFKEAKSNNKTNYRELLKHKSRAGLLELVAGKVIKTKTIFKKRVNGRMLIVREVIAEKYIPPNIIAIIFALRHLDKENFGEEAIIIQRLDPERIRISKMSNEELQKESEELEIELQKARELHRKRQMGYN